MALHLIYEFSEKDFVRLCVENAKRKNTTIFQDICDAFTSFLCHQFNSDLKITEIKNTSKLENHDKSLSIQDYLNQGSIEFHYPSIDIYSNKNNPLSIESASFPEFIKITDSSYGHPIPTSIKVKKHDLKTKNKLSVQFPILRIESSVISKIIEQTISIDPGLQPSKLGVWEWRQTFYNKITGNVYFCECFESALKISESKSKHRSHAHIQKALNEKSFKKSICHLCKKTNSDLYFCSPMYGSSFKVKYGAYIKKTEIENSLSERDAENIIRQEKGVAKIGERWINETFLFNYIAIIFPEYTVQREASPSWIGRQRLDIFIPEIGLAIEYQGEQHFKSIEIFGGEEGLKIAQKRDKEKLSKCRENNISIVYFTYKDELSEKLVTSRLKNFLIGRT